jgi:hypothetical protein
MVRKGMYVCLVTLPVALLGIYALRQQLPVGPIVLGISLNPLSGIVLAKRPLHKAHDGGGPA